ncbi:hypothetical protein ACMD2_24373 [Ananas comosus]|uniref:Uncharacterized protein n=1 Tax=Ananas comosus TaxID=4615 RepID=A0A199VVM8_ANACO|nr:hypothetical protein ACMD2_24373 [Ananas comosus]
METEIPCTVVKGGDANTKFFHLKASDCRNRNFIFRISDDSSTFSSYGDISDYLFAFFYNQLGTKCSPKNNINFSLLYGEEHCDFSNLLMHFNVSEVKKAILASALEKPLGLDASYLGENESYALDLTHARTHGTNTSRAKPRSRRRT